MSKKQQLLFTAEQEAIIKAAGNMRINAVAGSGKTTTVIAYAASRPATARILYLAFNKSVKLEAVEKFKAAGLNNVQVETAHSLAYRQVVSRFRYKVRSQGYKTHEIVELLQLQQHGEKHTEYILANHINKFISYFCNSDKLKVQELNYLDTIHDSKAKTFVHSFYPFLEQQTRQFLAKMDRGEIEITHDFYLKKFQLGKPALPYDYILFDEGQDASAVMLDIFMRQQATKVIVGDTHQQIYGWRYAVNSLAKADFDSFDLSVSFRFAQSIADLAMETLMLKDHLGDFKPVNITGKGTNQEEKTKATIARTNLGLLLNAINFIADNRKVKHIYFEGNINSYVFADEGTSLYDVLNLYTNKHDRIRDKLLQSMSGLGDLEEYIEKTEDAQLSMMLEIVREYEEEIYTIMQTLKSMQVAEDEKHKAAMIFSTVHRAKGMEYDIVHLADDFITADKLTRQIEEHKKKKENLDLAKWNEEINLLYVAITRTKHKLYIPAALLPIDFPASPNILPVVAQSGSTKIKDKPLKKYQSLEEDAGRYKRQKNAGPYKPWTPELDEELKLLYQCDQSINDLAVHFNRTKGAIMSRLKKFDYFVE